jgi:maltooligosyltrehalose trehalohydrolase
LQIRATEIVPRLAGTAFLSAHSDGALINATWRLLDASLFLMANLSAQNAERRPGLPPGRPIWGGKPPETLPPWSVYWSIGAA